jgi:hypothetical protein
MFQVRESQSHQQKVHSDTKPDAPEPLPRRWVELVRHLAEVEREEKKKIRKPEAP